MTKLGLATIDDIRLNTFDGRPIYRVRSEGRRWLVYADDGGKQTQVSREMISRIASAWTGQPADSAEIESVNEIDQWTVQGSLRTIRPLFKYSWRDGVELYISGTSAEVVQYTTRASRFWAYAGPISHWLYFTPLRKQEIQWSRVVIWCSGLGTIIAMLGLVIGVSIYSPAKRYRFDGIASSIPYRGQKRWHMMLGLIFGLSAVTWTFSGLLSMDPFPLDRPECESSGGFECDPCPESRHSSLHIPPGSSRARLCEFPPPPENSTRGFRP